MPRKNETDTEELQHGNNIAFAEPSQKSFYKAPAQPIERLLKIEKNKCGLFEKQTTPEIDEEINRLKNEGMDSRQISAELAKQGTMITWQRVRKRLLFIARKKPRGVAQTPVTGPKSLGPQRSSPAKMTLISKQEEHFDFPSDLAERIIFLNDQKLSPHSISDALEEESGATLSESQVMDIIIRKARGEI